MRTVKWLRATTRGAARWILGACGLALAAAPRVSAAPPGGGTTQPPPPPWSVVHDTTYFGDNDYGRFSAVATGALPCSIFVNSPCEVIGVATTNFGDERYVESKDGGTTWVTENFLFAGAPVSHLDIVIHAGNPFIALRNEATDRMWLAWKGGPFEGSVTCDGAVSPGWSCTKIVGVSGGYYSSIAINDSGIVYIAHMRTNGAIQFVRVDPPYNTFSIVAEIGCATSPCSSEDLPRSIRLVIDDISRIHLAWATGTKLKYAYADPSFASDIGDLDEVVETYPLGGPDDGQVGLVVDEFELPHIAYTARSSSGQTIVRHVRKTDYRTGAWVGELVSTLLGGVEEEDGVGPLNRVDLVLTSSRQDTAAITFGRSGTGGPPGSFVISRPSTSRSGWSTSGIDGGGEFGGIVRLQSGKFLVVHRSNEYPPHLRILRQN